MCLRGLVGLVILFLGFTCFCCDCRHVFSGFGVLGLVWLVVCLSYPVSLFDVRFLFLFWMMGFGGFVGLFIFDFAGTCRLWVLCVRLCSGCIF